MYRPEICLQILCKPISGQDTLLVAPSSGLLVPKLRDSIRTGPPEAESSPKVNPQSEIPVPKLRDRA